ncbi:MAG TPA: PKD domain-containing protein, partial [Candidatus Polarisedimenticolia bacterium]|nr:PKD domain-containing protein [Candidatus Polarisedimenticolia bacterium]
LNFLRQGDINGPLFLAGARGNPILDDRDRLNLYEVLFGPDNCGAGEEVCLVTAAFSKHISPFPTTFGSRLANLAAASTFYVSPSGELIFYATEHDNDGPGDTVKAGEWRHKDVVRDDSPTLLPHADIVENYEVEEGDSITLTGIGRPPVTRAFIELYKQHDMQDFCAVFDYDDVFILGDVANVSRLCFLDSDNGIRSWSWYAPEGCSIRATHTQLGGVKTLKGTGRIERDFDLSTVLNNAKSNDMEMRVDRIVFEGDCDAYYDTSAALEWDLNLDGVFETTGTDVTFDSRGFDGPSVVSVPVQARHPDSTLTGSAIAKVVVRNRIPVILDINFELSGIPFALVGLPVTVKVDFSDPGTPDHQTAGIAWGDGTSDPHTAFASFNDAFGGVIGHAVASHVFTSPAEFKTIVTVTDDDGGAEVDSAKVKVVTVEQALDVAIDLLENKIDSTSNPVIRKILEKAFKALYGNAKAQNGALEMVRTGNDASAIMFLNQAIGWLKVASGFGADVSTLTAILQQMVLALQAGL